MNPIKPVVSVVMINYNGMPWLEMAVESILASEDIPFELVVVDDCSSDNSREYLSQMEIADSRIRAVCLEENLGISGARNAGIKASHGDYIAIIDSDDRFLPDTLKMQLATFEKLKESYPQLSLLMSDAWLINEKGERVGRYISSDWWGRTSAENPPLWTLPSTFFFRKDHSARFHPGYRSADAPIFVSRMQKLGPVAFTGEPLIEYRLRMSSVTNVSGARMLREMNAAEQSRRLDRLDDPIPPDEVPEPDRSDLAAWIHGRNAKNAAANGRSLIAAKEVFRAALANPGKTFAKLKRATKTYGRRFTGKANTKS
jgi:glycosyltransferase involved in cell wall biosynthesis